MKLLKSEPVMVAAVALSLILAALITLGKLTLSNVSDFVETFGAVLVICALASVIAIRMALRVDPAEAIGG